MTLAIILALAAAAILTLAILFGRAASERSGIGRT